VNVTGEILGRIKRGVAAGTLGQVINLVGRLLLVPLFLSTWGVALYGEWLILSAMTAMLAISDFGGGVYYVNRLTAIWQIGQYEEFVGMLSTGLVILTIVPLCLLGLLVWVVTSFPIGDLLGLNLVSPDVIITTVMLLGVQIAISLPQGLLLGVYRSIGAQATSMMLGNALIIGQLVATAAVLLYGGDFVNMALILLVPVSLLIIYVLVDLRLRQIGRPLFHFSHVSLDLLRKSISPSMHFFIIRLAQVVVIQGTVLVVGRTLGTVSVAIFSTSRMMMNMVMQIFSVFSHSAWPEFTRLASNRDFLRLRHLYFFISRLVLFIAVSFVLLMEVVGDRIFDLWVGQKLLFDEDIVRFLGWYIVLRVGWTLNANLLMACNRHEVLARWQVVAAFSGVSFFALGILIYGLPGAVIGLIAGESLLMCWITVSLVAQAPWGLSVRHLVIELVPALLAMLLCYWPVIGVIAVLLLGWRVLQTVNYAKLLRLYPVK